VKVTFDIPEERLREMVRELIREERAHVAEPAPASPYMTVKEAAEYLRCQPHRIYNLLSEGRLTRYKDGYRVLISRAEVDAHLRGEPTGPLGRTIEGVTTTW
jgi:excisionase family DNA binding protein